MTGIGAGPEETGVALERVVQDARETAFREHCLPNLDRLIRAVEARTREQVAREAEENRGDKPADFFQPGYTYTRHDGTTFQCDAITTHPTSGWLLALGWHTDTADWTFLAHQGVDQWNHDYDQNGERR